MVPIWATAFPNKTLISPQLFRWLHLKTDILHHWPWFLGLIFLLGEWNKGQSPNEFCQIWRSSMTNDNVNKISWDLSNKVIVPYLHLNLLNDITFCWNVSLVPYFVMSVDRNNFNDQAISSIFLYKIQVH